MKGLSHVWGSLLLGLLISPTAWGWGQIGHRASGYIAEAHLTPHSKNVLRSLFPNENLADISTWADTLRSSGQFRHTATYHYDGLPAGVGYLDHLRKMNPQQVRQGGALQAVLAAQKEIESPEVSANQKAVALRFLVHFMGDLHQPFHSGRPEDKGGNLVRLSWFGRPTNLHAVWDTGMIITGHEDIFGRPAFVDQSLLYAQKLMETHRGLFPPENTRDNPEAWLMESVNTREPAYDPRMRTNPEAYQRAQLPVLDLRIYTAGVRIADVVNRILANQPAPNSQQQLLRQIEALLGRIENLITLGPRRSQLPVEDWN